MWDTRHQAQPLCTLPERGETSPLLSAATRVAARARVTGVQSFSHGIHGDAAEYAVFELTLASAHVVGVTMTIAVGPSEDRPLSPAEALADLALRSVFGDLDALASLLMLVGFDYTAYLRRQAAGGR